MKIELKSEKLILRKLRTSDAASIYLNARDKEIPRFMPPLPYPYKLADAKEFIKNSIKEWVSGDNITFGITLKEKDEVIGTIALNQKRSSPFVAEVGYWLGKKYWRQGIGTEALQLILSYGFNKLKLKRIFAKVLSGNEASYTLLKKNGFKFEGCLRRHVFSRGRWHDDLIFGILKEEFKK